MSRPIVTIYERRALYWTGAPPDNLPFLWGQGRTLRAAMHDALARTARAKAVVRYAQERRRA